MNNSESVKQTENKESLLLQIRLSIAKYKYILLFSVFLIFASIIVILFNTQNSLALLHEFVTKDNHLFYWMLLVGFFAEIVAGSMGMGYGVICTTILLILNNSES